MTWLDEFKSSYKGWSRSTRLVAVAIGVVVLMITGLFPVVALVYVVWMSKKWWDKRQVQKGAGFSNANLATQLPDSVPQPPVTQPTQDQVPPPVPPPLPPTTQPDRPTINWNKP
jgi:hypothetical protein